MKFNFGATINDHDGKQVGILKEIVVHPAAKKVTHLVVQKGLLFPCDTLIPVEAVHVASETVIALKIRTADLDRVGAAYDPQQFVEIPPEVWAESATVSVDPELPSRAWTRPVDAEPLPAVPPSLIPPGIGRMEISEPVTIDLDEATLDPGTPVLGADGKKLGELLEVVMDDQKAQITHLLIELSQAGKEAKLVPVDWVAALDDNQVQLAAGIGSSQIDALPEGD